MHWSEDCYDTVSQKVVDWHLCQPNEEGVQCNFEHIHGHDFWEHLRRDPRKGETFSKAMNNVNALGRQSLKNLQSH